MKKNEKDAIELNIENVYRYLSRLEGEIFLLSEQLEDFKAKEKKRSGMIGD